MKNIKLIINFKEDKAFLTPDYYLKLEKIEISDIIKTFQKEASISFKIKRFLPSEKKAKAEILNYNLNKIDFSETQLSLAEELKKIEYISWKNIDIKVLKYIALKKEKASKKATTSKKNTGNKINTTLPVKNLIYKNGYAVSKISIHVKEKAQEFNLKFKNKVITPGFQILSPFYYRELQNRPIRISFQLPEDDITEIDAFSDSIENISRTRILKYREMAFKKFLRKRIDHSKEFNFFDTQSFFELLSNSTLNYTQLFKNEADFVLEIAKILNCPHLQKIKYFLKHHAYKVMKIRYIARFLSIVFLIEKESKYYLVWESLKVRKASDIWTLPKDANQVDMAMQDIPKIIHSMNINGKKSLPDGLSENFTRIEYNYSNLLNSFDLWQNDFNYFVKQTNKK